MLPEASQARKAIWDAVNPHSGLRRIDEAFPLELRKVTRNNEMQIEFLNGSTWQVVGSDNYNSLVGSTPAGIVYSEWALSNPSARAYLRPIITENNGWQIFITTPRGKNHAYSTLKAAEKDSTAFAQVLNAYSTGVFTREQLDGERLAYIAEFGEDMGQAMFEQEYLCSFDAAILGAVLGRWLSRARGQNRMRDGVFDPDGGVVDISSDLGYRDTASWWFWQRRLDGFGLVGYEGASGRDADDWIDFLQAYLTQKGFKLGTIWMPHDARAKTFTSKHSAMERFLLAFGADHVRVVPQTKVADRINAARRVISRCVFDEAECHDGIEGLTSWAFEYDLDTRTFTKDPKHDWASHPGDAFSYGAQMVEEDVKRMEEEEPLFPVKGTSTGFQLAPLEELWKSAPRGAGRI